MRFQCRCALSIVQFDNERTAFVVMHTATVEK
jgi:hypothetical protein